MGIVSKGFDLPSPIQEEAIPMILASNFSWKYFWKGNFAPLWINTSDPLFFEPLLNPELSLGEKSNLKINKIYEKNFPWKFNAVCKVSHPYNPYNEPGF